VGGHIHNPGGNKLVYYAWGIGNVSNNLGNVSNNLAKAYSLWWSHQG
jgi:hypothetical protein